MGAKSSISLKHRLTVFENSLSGTFWSFQICDTNMHLTHCMVLPLGWRASLPHNMLEYERTAFSLQRIPWVRILFGKFVVRRLVNKLLVSYGIRNSITMFPGAHHCLS
jgi:hypothetical protein